MIPNKPSILIYSNQAQSDVIRDVCAGIEEEGLLYEVMIRHEINPVHLAYEAAANSIVGSGIGIVQNEIVFTLKNLPKHQVVEYYKRPTSEEAKNLGSNSARAVKRMPFRLKERTI